MPAFRSVDGSTAATSASRRAVSALAFVLLALALAGCVRRDDALAPVVTIYEPQSGTTRSVEALMERGVRGYAMDDGGIAAIRVDGFDLLQTETYAAERGKGFVDFAFRPNAPTEGETVSIIEVVDESGRSTRIPYTLRIDATPPTIELLSVETLEDGRLEVRGVARDNEQVSVVRVSDEPLQFIPRAEVRFEIDVASGESGVVEVIDGAGNRTVTSLR